MSSSGAAILLLHLMFCGRGATLSYYVDEHESVWNTTSPACTLASPVVTYSEHGVYVELPGNLALVPGEEYMVGYIKTLKVFDYLGCISASRAYRDVPGLEVHKDIPADPGQCFSVCGGRYFGISNTTCYCLLRVVRDGLNECVYSCTNPKNTVCGGCSDQEKYISVYEHVEGMAGPGDEKYCLAISTASNKFFWETCGRKMSGYCKKSPLSNASLPTSSPLPRRSVYPWNEYVNTCFTFNLYPLIEKKVPIVYVDSGEGLWTGRIRSWVIETITEADSSNIDYGYFDNTDLRTTTEHISVSRNNKMSGVDEKTTGNAMIAVYVMSPIVLTAVVLGTICFLRRRRRQKDSNYVNTGIRFNNTQPTPGVTNAAYGGIAIQAGPEKVQDHSYSVLEKESDYAAIDPDDDSTKYDTTTTRVNNDNDGKLYNTLEVTSDDTYDQTGDIIAKTKHTNDNDGNVYNTLERSSDDTYAHTGYEINKIKNIDDTYNHAGKEGDTENEYSTANKWNDTRDSKQTFDDTYNHI